MRRPCVLIKNVEARSNTWRLRIIKLSLSKKVPFPFPRRLEPSGSENAYRKLVASRGTRPKMDLKVLLVPTRRRQANDLEQGTG